MRAFPLAIAIVSFIVFGVTSDSSTEKEQEKQEVVEAGRG